MPYPFYPALPTFRPSVKSFLGNRALTGAALQRLPTPGPASHGPERAGKG